eukprot:GHVP01058707.1.p1 GENE.GHVP01058707.1~~GHVP01058707.1.p1  ORF type:complete len:159 (+),score=30.94 GHVP01058707.1:31-477(+)
MEIIKVVQDKIAGASISDFDCPSGLHNIPEKSEEPAFFGGGQSKTAGGQSQTADEVGSLLEHDGSTTTSSGDTTLGTLKGGCYGIKQVFSDQIQEFNGSSCYRFPPLQTNNTLSREQTTRGQIGEFLQNHFPEQSGNWTSEELAEEYL